MRSAAADPNGCWHSTQDAAASSSAITGNSDPLYASVTEKSRAAFHITRHVVLPTPGKGSSVKRAAADRFAASRADSAVDFNADIACSLSLSRLDKAVSTSFVRADDQAASAEIYP